MIKTEPELAILKVIEAINLFPDITPEYFYKLAYYLQRVGFYEQTYTVLQMVLNDFDIKDYSMYNMYVSKTLEKFCTYKYAEKEYKDYVFYYFKWLHNRLLAYACQGRTEEMYNIINSKDMLIHLAKTKMEKAIKNMQVQIKYDEINQKVIKYINSNQEDLINIAKLKYNDKEFRDTYLSLNSNKENKYFEQILNE